MEFREYHGPSNADLHAAANTDPLVKILRLQLHLGSVRYTDMHDASDTDDLPDSK